MREEKGLYLFSIIYIHIIFVLYYDVRVSNTSYIYTNVIFFYNYDRNRFPKKYHNMICYDNKKRTLEKNSVQKK